MKAHLLTIGDELLIGQTVNTNAAWLGEQLSQLGLHVVQATTVGDQEAVLREALDDAFEVADLVITTGGLGPTHDDITKKVVAEYLDQPLREHDGILERLRDYYARTGRDIPDAARGLALVPADFELLDNPVGTAPGLWFAGSVDGHERMLAVLPGVPQEMKGIVRESLVPRLEARGDLQTVAHRTLRTTGIGESSLQEKIGDIVDELRDDVHLAYLPSTSGVRLRLTAFGSNRSEAEEHLHAVEERLRERAGKYIFGTGDDTLEGVLGAMLRERGLTIATAESCTGGFVAHRLTNVGGSSDYFMGSVVSYANSVKQNQLGVSAAALEEYGAVSEPVARQMARGVREALGTDIGISTTGIAGPTGGTPDKPVGTLWLGYADADTTRAVELHFTQDRSLNKELFSTSALELVRRQLLRREEQVAPAS
jgi:nicotinamide-nucleotide amidase